MSPGHWPLSWHGFEQYVTPGCWASPTHARSWQTSGLVHTPPTGTQSGSGTGQLSSAQTPFSPQSFGQSEP